MKMLIINNHSAGLNDGTIFDFVRLLSTNDTEITIRTTDFNTPISELLCDFENFDAVVASGGDGTVSAICYELRNSQVPILPFPAGTANLLALNLMSPCESHGLANLIKEQIWMDFDLGEIEYGDRKHGFTVMAGCGYDATLMKNAAPIKKYLGQMAYLSAALGNVTPEKSEYTINIDGKAFTSSGFGVIIVNFSKIQFDISIVDTNLPHDGMFAVLLLKGKSALDLIPALLSKYIEPNTKMNDFDCLEVYYGNYVEVDADPPAPIQFDGESTNQTTPFKARVLPCATRLVISKETANYFNDGN